MRQARSELTRRRIITAAVDLFSENGYAATGLGDIVERAQLTKGALYYHFDSKESLATAIIEEGAGTLRNAFRDIEESSSPAVESIIHGGFVVIDMIAVDKVSRAAIQLLRGLAGFNETVRDVYASWLSIMTQRVSEAIADGDLRAGLDAGAVAEMIVGAMISAELLSIVGEDDVRQRVTRFWEVVLPSIVDPQSLDYFREFLARESLRRPTPDNPE